MVRIIADTSTLYSTAQARDAGFAVSPLSVTINEQTYREFDEISSEEFVSMIHQGHMPTSSQPAVGEVVSLYEEYAGDEILNISMADGLSGTYNSAVAAAELCEDRERITVMNSKTLCGPHRHLVEQALRLAREGLGRSAIVERLESLMATEKSYLIPDDFAYLCRGGRLSPLVSLVGQVTHLTPIMTLTEDARQLTVAGVRRSFRQAVHYIAKALSERGVGKDWRVYITHAAAPEKAAQAREILLSLLPDAIYEVHPLSPAFITQGGPRCVAIQVIHN